MTIDKDTAANLMRDIARSDNTGDNRIDNTGDNGVDSSSGGSSSSGSSSGSNGSGSSSNEDSSASSPDNMTSSSNSNKDSSASQHNTTTRSSQAGDDDVDVTTTNPTTLGELKDMLKTLLKKSAEQEDILKALTTASKVREKGRARRSLGRFRLHSLRFATPRTVRRTKSDITQPLSLRAADPTPKRTNGTTSAGPAASRRIVQKRRASSARIAQERQAPSGRIAQERQAASRRIVQQRQAASGGIAQTVGTDDNPRRTRTSRKYSTPAWKDRSQARRNSADIERDQDLADEERDLYSTKKFELEQERKALLQTQNDEMAKMQAQLERATSDFRVAQSQMHREITSTNERITELTTCLNVTAIKAHKAETTLNRITNYRHDATKNHKFEVRTTRFHEGELVLRKVS